MHVFTTAFALLATITSAWAYPGPGVVTGNTAVHDPTLCKDASGTYFVFSTGTGIEIRTSPDRTAWTYIGNVWSTAPTATNQFTGTTNGVLWAPDCLYANNKFHLFYAASSFGSQNSGIFYATSNTGQPGSWTDQGLVLSTVTGDSYNAIDPNLLISANGIWYLSLGSFWTGIKQVQLTSSGALASSTVTSLAERSGTDAIEASVVYSYGSYFYLFTSWDLCCEGTSSTYNIRVGRSTSINGPYVDQSNVALTSGGGTLVLETHDSIYGPGGQDLFTDSDGPILVYHYYTSTGSYLGINKLDFSSGWPVVI
ncbi:glycoside hydrolase family 43 protein [Cytidiella melzeri]|nr:glycoside hydrolase family 43 protein [Cytidiella melzeri]